MQAKAAVQQNQVVAQVWYNFYWIPKIFSISLTLYMCYLKKQEAQYLAHAIQQAQVVTSS